MRLQLGVPENDLIEPVTFNRLLSVGSATLIVLFALPIAFGLYTYVVPSADRGPLARLPAARLALPVAVHLRRRPALRELRLHAARRPGFNSWPPLSDTVFISNNGPDVWITAVGLTVAGPRAAVASTWR